MSPTEQSECQSCGFRGEVLARLDGIKNEINNGFKNIRSNLDKIERDQYKQWDGIKDNSVLIGKSSLKIEANSQRISSFKWVMGILITLSLANLAFLVRLAVVKPGG